MQALLRINSENNSSPQSNFTSGEVSSKETCGCVQPSHAIAGWHNYEFEVCVLLCFEFADVLNDNRRGSMHTLHLPPPSLHMHKPNKLSVQVKIPTSKTVKDSDPKVRNPVRFVKHTSSLCRQLFPESLFFGSSEESSLQSSNMCSSDFIRVIIFLDFVHHRAEFLNDCVGSLPKLVEFWMLSFGDYWIVEKY